MLCIASRSLVLFLLLGGTASWAQSQDAIKMRAGLTALVDNNFLRSSAASAVSERVTSQTLGITLAVPVSLQRFELDASIVGNQHQTLTNFDYTAQNYNAAWQWGFTPQLRGSLTSTRAESLNSAGDSLNPNLRNKNTTQSTALSAAYDLGGPWQATAGLSNTSTVNERALIGQTDNRSSGVNAGLRYTQPSGNSWAYSLQSAMGASGSDYTSTTHDLSGTWVLSGNTSVKGNMALLQQHFGVAPQFDFSGTSGALMVTWRATGKTSVTAGWQRSLTSYQTAGTTHAQTDSYTAGPVWQMSPKTSLRLQYRYAVRDDRGNPTGAPTARQDRTQDTSLSYSWQPHPLATLSATVGDFARSSNVANADYTARQITLAAQFAF